MPRYGSALCGPAEPGGPLPCRHLAARVIEQALKDVLRSGQTASDRRTARRFLAGSSMLYFWCEVAGLDAGEVIRVAAGLTGGNGHRAAATRASASEHPLRAHA